LGGNGLAVSRTSAHPREALELVRFLMRRDAQTMRAREHSELPMHLEIYELPAIFKAYPEFSSSREHRSGLVARPSVAAGPKYEEVTRAYIRTLHTVLSGEKSPSVAAADLEKELIEITGFRTGSPQHETAIAKTP
jgi:trehalose/maltose transport system substrate-binding protein